MQGPWKSIISLLITTALVGCKGTVGPAWAHPGSARAQQTQALRYDPYPENESGPPMVGVRPREYEKPPSEASRSRWFLGKWGQ
jgi:hypothetical protein